MIKLRTTSGRPRSVEGWIWQVSVSLGATLIVTLVSSAVVHPADRSPLQPELTSGGKFAARTIPPVAYDGLDTMPLPRVSEALTRSAPPSKPAPAPVPHRSSSSRAALSAPVPAGPAARPTHAVARADGRRGKPVSRSVLMTAPGPVAGAASSVPGLEARDEHAKGVASASKTETRPVILATAMEAWAVAAAVGDDLATHVLR